MTEDFGLGYLLFIKWVDNSCPDYLRGFLSSETFTSQVFLESVPFLPFAYYCPLSRVDDTAASYQASSPLLSNSDFVLWLKLWDLTSKYSIIYRFKSIPFWMATKDKPWTGFHLNIHALFIFSSPHVILGFPWLLAIPLSHTTRPAVFHLHGLAFPVSAMSSFSLPPCQPIVWLTNSSCAPPFLTTHPSFFIDLCILALNSSKTTYKNPCDPIFP